MHFFFAFKRPTHLMTDHTMCNVRSILICWLMNKRVQLFEGSPSNHTPKKNVDEQEEIIFGC